MMLHMYPMYSRLGVAQWDKPRDAIDRRGVEAGSPHRPTILATSVPTAVDHGKTHHACEYSRLASPVSRIGSAAEPNGI